MFTISPVMECGESNLPVDTCQGASSWPYPLGWIRIVSIVTQPWTRLRSTVNSAARTLSSLEQLRWNGDAATTYGLLKTNDSPHWMLALIISTPPSSLFAASNACLNGHTPFYCRLTASILGQPIRNIFPSIKETSQFHWLSPIRDKDEPVLIGPST